MDAKTQDAVKRVHDAIKGLHPANHPHTVNDEHGTPVRGVRTPIAEVNADDILTLCDAVPMSKVDTFVKETRRGAAEASDREAYPEGRPVYKQTQCLWRLLGLVAGLTPESPPEQPAAA